MEPTADTTSTAPSSKTSGLVTIVNPVDGSERELPGIHVGEVSSGLDAFIFVEDDGRVVSQLQPTDAVRKQRTDATAADTPADAPPGWKKNADGTFTQTTFTPTADTVPPATPAESTANLTPPWVNPQP